MSDYYITRLCQLIAELLHSTPDAEISVLIECLREKIATDSEFKVLFQGNASIQQINQGNTQAFQTIVEEGGVANFGEHYHIFDHEKFREILESFLLTNPVSQSPSTPPKNLPDRTSQFVGRDEEMQRLHEQLQQHKQVTLWGMGGVGKTELAAQYAWKHWRGGTYPGGLCWLRARDQDLGPQIIKFAQVQLNLKLRDLDLHGQIADCWQRWPLGDVLVIIDDVTDQNKIKAFLPPQESRFKLLLTTRNYIDILHSVFRLDALNEVNALECLSLTAKTDYTDELDIARELCQWVGYLPLGIKFIGRYLNRKHGQITLGELQNNLYRKRLEAKALGSRKGRSEILEPHESILAAFELSWQELIEPEKHLAFCISLFALAPIEWDLIKLCFDEDPEDLEDWRDEGLVNHSLLQIVGEKQYQLHQLVREFFQLKFQNDEQFNEEYLSRRVCRTLTSVSQNIPNKLTLNDVKKVTDAIPHITEMVISLSNFLADEDFSGPFIGLTRFYSAQGDYDEEKSWCEKWYSMAQERFGHEHREVAASINRLGLVYRRKGQYIEAEKWLEKSLILSRKLLGEDHIVIATILNNLGLNYCDRGLLLRAGPCLKKSLRIQEENSKHVDFILKMNTMSNLACYYTSLRIYSQAEVYARKVLEMKQQKLGTEHPEVAEALNNLAAIYDSQRRYSIAESLYTKSLNIRKKFFGGNHPDVAQSLHNLGSLYAKQNQFSQAKTLLEKALCIFTEYFGTQHHHTSSVRGSLQNVINSTNRNEPN